MILEKIDKLYLYSGHQLRILFLCRKPTSSLLKHLKTRAVFSVLKCLFPGFTLGAALDPQGRKAANTRGFQVGSSTTNAQRPFIKVRFEAAASLFDTFQAMTFGRGSLQDPSFSILRSQWVEKLTQCLRGARESDKAALIKSRMSLEQYKMRRTIFHEPTVGASYEEQFAIWSSQDRGNCQP